MFWTPYLHKVNPIEKLTEKNLNHRAKLCEFHHGKS